MKKTKQDTKKPDENPNDPNRKSREDFLEKYQCKYLTADRQCQLIGTAKKSNEYANIYCNWHDLVIEKPMDAQSLDRFKEWRESQRNEYDLSEFNILLYLDDDTVWKAITGKLLHVEFMVRYYFPREKEFKAFQKLETEQACKELGLNTIQDHIDYCKTRRGEITEELEK